MTEKLKSHLDICNKYISENDINNAVVVISKIENKNNYQVKLLIKKIQFIIQKINEEQEIIDKKNNFIKNGEIYYLNNQLKDALNCYLIGLYITYNPIFYFYIGKIYYELGNYEESKCYLKYYLLFNNNFLKTFNILNKIENKTLTYKNKII